MGRAREYGACEGVAEVVVESGAVEEVWRVGVLVVDGGEFVVLGRRIGGLGRDGVGGSW